MKRMLLVTAILCLFSGDLFSGTYTMSFSNAEDWDKCLYDWKIDVTTSPNEVTLLRTELIADEMGATTYTMGEIIVGDTRIKKEFYLERVEADKALLLIHCNTHDMSMLKNRSLFLWVTVNEKPIKLFIDVERMLTGGWVRCDVPVQYLKDGLNEVTIHNETKHEVRISAEASRIPNRSAKSIDGGKTWDYDHLGKNDFIDGEYLVRLRLGRYPARAEIKSDFIELASLVTDEVIKPEIRLRSIAVELKSKLPAGTSVDLKIRGGKTPAYNPESWSHWQAQSEVNDTVISEWKFFQWRIELKTEDHRVSPAIEEVAVSADIDIINSADKRVGIKQNNNQKIIRGYYEFAHQEHDLERLHMLKERYRLDEVTAGCTTQFQEIRTLAFWMRGIWRDGWNTEYNKTLHTPWDAFTALLMTPHYQASGMCTIYSTTFVQCALSLGYHARGIVLDHHYVSEVWIDDLQKWVTIDIAATTTSLRSSFYEKDGIPLNS